MIFENNEIIELPKGETYKLKKIYVKELLPLKYAHLAKSPNDNADLYEAYIYTLNKHGFRNKFQSELNNPLYRLSQYDKINQHKNDPYLIKLDRLLMLLNKHLKIIDELNTLPKDSTPHTSYSNHKKFIAKEIQSLKTTLYEFKLRHKDKNLLYDYPYCEDYKYYNTTISLLELYCDYPMLFSIFLKNAHNPRYEKLYDGMDTDIKNYADKIYSYTLKLNSTHLTKSFNLFAIGIYKNDSLYNQLLNIKKQINDKDLISELSIITEQLLDNKALPNLKNLTASCDYIDLIDDLFIIQPNQKKKQRTTTINNYNEFLSSLKNSKISIDF